MADQGKNRISEEMPQKEAGIEVVPEESRQVGTSEAGPKPEAEKRAEQAKEAAAEKEEEGKVEEKVTLTPPIGGEEAVLPKDPMVEKIEKILEEDLEQVYLLMTPEQQKIFKDKGEETASKIRILVQRVKIRVKEILSIIREWLATIPGVNKFFIEQEAKIKTDKILEMAETEKK